MRFEILGLGIGFTVLLLQQDIDIINYVYFGVIHFVVLQLQTCTYMYMSPVLQVT